MSWTDGLSLPDRVRTLSPEFDTLRFLQTGGGSGSGEWHVGRAELVIYSYAVPALCGAVALWEVGARTVFEDDQVCAACLENVTIEEFRRTDAQDPGA